MTRFKFAISALAVLMILAFIFTPTGLVQAKSILVDEEPLPTPVYPSYSDVTTKTPSFYFYPHSQGIKYRIKVTDLNGPTTVYVYKGVPTCDPEEPLLPCWMTPDIPLKVVDLTHKKGRYVWQVAVKIGDNWEEYTESAFFMVANPGFDSDFNVDAKKWVSIEGDWILTTTGSLKNKGPALIWTSAAHKWYAVPEYAYEVRMKLKSGMPEEHKGGIIINGTIGERFPEETEWYAGYYFLYKNNQTAAIFKREYGNWITMVDWTFTDLIVPGDWNTLKAELEFNELKVYINGTLWQMIDADLLNMGGWVGVTQYRPYREIKETMEVDWAKLSILHPFSIE